MPESAKSPLAELREVEARVAARTARIDQLQAAVAASSQSRGRKFSRTLLLVGYISVSAAALLGFELPAQLELSVALGVAAVGLALIAILSTTAIDRFVRERSFLGPATTAVIARWIARSPTWQLPSTPTHFVSARRRRHLATYIALGAGALGIAIWRLGSIALAGFALAVAVALLRSTWSRRISAPAMVQRGAILVALMAIAFMGLSFGVVFLQLVQHPATLGFSADTPHGGVTTLRTSLPYSGSDPATYSSLCPGQAPWSDSDSLPVVRMRETWLATGAGVAGCPGPIRGASLGGVMVSRGTLEGVMKSLGVADQNRAALIVGQPAVIAASLLKSRGLVDVPTHLVVGGGDLYLVDTRQGTYVLAQSAKDDSAGYLTLPPALADLWVEAMSGGSGWLWPVRSPADHSADRSYLFAGYDSRIAARATCRIFSGSCVLSGASGGPVRARGAHWIPPGLLLRYAPSF